MSNIQLEKIIMTEFTDNTIYSIKILLGIGQEE